MQCTRMRFLYFEHKILSLLLIAFLSYYNSSDFINISTNSNVFLSIQMQSSTMTTIHIIILDLFLTVLLNLSKEKQYAPTWIDFIA